LRVVAGLGNPGLSYRRTRHNAGSRTVDILAARAGVEAPASGSLGSASAEQGTFAWLAETMLAGQPVLLVKPLAFMNASGVPVARVLAAAGASPADLVVIVDDVALELGTIRVRARGRHGGHNGLRSVIDEIGTEDFVRVRIGVRRGELPPELADYVLAEVPSDEAPALEAALGRAADAVECVLREGPAAAMDRFNGRRA
jgi:PTH1 family peptidyl-tRNA hydrolase